MERAICPPPPPPRRRALRKGTTTTTAGGKAISDLPDNTICDILSRLPLQSIFRCKQVCKNWRKLLLEPYFAKLHLSRSPLSLILYRRPDRTNPSHFGVLELDDPARLRRRNATIKFRTEFHIADFGLEIVGSCNGSICLSDCRSEGTVIVCNPIRGHRFILPEPPNLGYNSKFGFGYSPSTDRYKVLRFTETRRDSSRLDCDVYTLGNDEDAWRSIGGTGQPPPLNFHNLVFVNGALHWVGMDDSRFMFICYVDIEKEQFGNFPLPSHIGRPSASSMSPGVVDGCLYIYDYQPSPSVVSIWAMKEYGNIGSLTLEWVIERPFPHRLDEEVKPVKILKDGTLLMILDKKTLASYNPETRILEKIRYHGIRFWAESVADVPSFLSPMDAMSENPKILSQGLVPSFFFGGENGYANRLLYTFVREHCLSAPQSHLRENSLHLCQGRSLGPTVCSGC